MSLLLLSSLGFSVPLRAERLSGRYLGTYNHLKNNGHSADRMSHLYDATIRDIISRDVNLDLGISLRHDSQPGVSNTAILRSRLFADVSNTIWRVRGTYVPWQRTQPGTAERRKRDFTFGADLMPRRGPELRVNFRRADRENELGMTHSSDVRADLEYSLRQVATHFSARHLESNGANPQATTNEYRAGINARHAWRQVAVTGKYDAVATKNKRMVGQTGRLVQDLGANLGWNPHKKLAISSTGSHRWENFDGIGAVGQESRRTSVTSRVAVFPVQHLTLDATQDFRFSGLGLTEQVNDQLRLSATYIRPIARGIQFRSGYSTRVDLRRSDTQNGLYFAANGVFRRNLQGGAELRITDSSGGAAGPRWSTAANVRTLPTRRTTLDVRWRSATRSDALGTQQSDRLWDLSLSYRPAPGINVNGVHRRTDGEGLVERQQRFWSLNAAWRFDSRSSARVFASARDTRVTGTLFQEDTIGGDLTFWPTRNFELRGRFQHSKFSHRDSVKLYGVNLSRLF